MSADKEKKMTLEDWNKFFQRIRPVIEKYKTALEEKRKSGDCFNIFSVLNVQRKEVRHSAFLSALLDPNGEHGLGNKFLSDFIKNIVHQQKNIGFDWDCNDVYVNTEEPTDEKDGRMDIYLRSKKTIVIVENKIDAKDGEKQLIRYDNHAKTKGDNHCLLYLTLNGQCASEITTNSENQTLKANTDYFPISYKNDILPWLERCLEIAKQHPRVRETIAQYIDLIKILTGTMSHLEINLIENLLKESNIEYLTEILAHEEDLYIRYFKNKFDKDNNWSTIENRYSGWGIMPPKCEKLYIAYQNGPDREKTSFGIRVDGDALPISEQPFEKPYSNANGQYPFGYITIKKTELLKGEILDDILNRIEERGGLYQMEQNLLNDCHQ